MRKPRIPHAPIPDAADFSPTEVATLGLLGIKRSDIYLRIRCGDINTIRNERGHYRITGAEIKRLQVEWRVDPKRIKPNPELVKSAQRSRARIATLENAAKYSAQEIGNRAVQGKRRHYAEQIDPEHKLPPDELERRIRRKDEAGMERARLAKIERRMLREQYGQDPA
jgi:hypothetical protein